jgi:hypothetical protein
LVGIELGVGACWSAEGEEAFTLRLQHGFSQTLRKKCFKITLRRKSLA